MPAIQVVLFDLGGTLLHYEQPPEYTFDRLNARALRALLGAAAEQGARVRDAEMAVRAVGRMTAAMDAKARQANYANTAENIIREGLEAVSIKLPAKAWDAGLAAYYEAISAVVKPVAGNAQAVLAELSEQGHGIGLVSNTFWARELHDGDLARFGLLDYIPVRVYSCEVGVTKPHPMIYRQALDSLDVVPAEAIFVGDKLGVDIAGPKKIGMRAVLVSSPYRTETDEQIVPDARIDSIDELPALLDVWERAMEPPVVS